MNNMAAFLAARLDEDEARRWAVHDVSKCDALLYEELPVDAPIPATDDCECGYPARVLREVDAKRKILAEHHATDWTAYGDHMCARCVYEDDEIPMELKPNHWVVFPCPTLRALAAAWSAHPDYDPAWQ